MSRLHSRAARHPLSRERSTGLVESDNVDDALPTLTTTRRRLHYMDFGRLELFLQRRLNEANERQNQQRQEPTAAVAVSSSIPPSPMTTQQGTGNATPAAVDTRSPPRSADNRRPRTWLRQANTARRRIAQRLSRVIAGCLRGGEAGGDDAACADIRKDEDGRDGGEGEGFDNQLRMRTLSVAGSRPRARTSYQRCNNATGSSDRGSLLNPNREDATAKSSVTDATAGLASTAAAAAVGVEKEPPSKALQTIDAVEIVEVEEVASAARTLNLRPAGPSGGSSPRSYATTLSAATPTQPISLPPSASPSKAATTLTSLKRPTPPRRRRQRLPEQSEQQSNNTSRRSYRTDITVDDRTALLRTGSQTAAEDEDTEDRIVNWNATKNTDQLKAKTKGGKGVRSAGGANKKPRKFTPQPGAGSVKKIAKANSIPAKQDKTATASHTTADKLVTLTSEGVAWSDQLLSLTKVPISKLCRPGAAERPAAQPLQEDPLYDLPKSVTLRRNIECPLVPLMTYKTDKKGELFYSVVQICQMCRKDVCPKCRRSLCAFCTAITCLDCRMLLHQMIEISRVDGAGRRNRPPQGQSLVRAGSSQQQRQQPQPYCHSCEKPVCLSCIDGLAMILPTNERCAQHSLSGNVYENTCPWCGRTICRECRRSSCFACTKAFQCACQGSCQCDSRAALPNS